MNNKQPLSIKRDLMALLIKAYLSDNFAENTRLIPFDLRPSGSEVAYRCCIYKERAILRTRIIASMGFNLEQDDERVNLTAYANAMEARTEISGKNLTVLQTACKGCTTNTIYVTDLCQGCVERPCEKACKFGAISVTDGRSKIDNEKCKKCGMCIKACPYNAIVKVAVPCEDVCPVGAMKKAENGLAYIDFDKCISCGKCIKACPFGAVHEKSQVLDIVKAMKQNKKVIAIIAPAVAGQFDCNLYQLKSAILKSGFADVYEVAKGADITTQNEAKEFLERMEEGKEFMTTSCCPGYIKLVKKHINELKPFVSDTATPMHYTAEFVKNKFPDSVVVFIGPCLAKRSEGFLDEFVDYVMSFEELGALFMAKDINPADCEETKYDSESSKQARNFCVTGGVAEAVKKALPDEELVNPMVINGLNKDSIKEIKKIVANGKCPNDCNLLEVMCCEGGCVAGNGNINNVKTAMKKLNSVLEASEDIKKIEE